MSLRLFVAKISLTLCSGATAVCRTREQWEHLLPKDLLPVVLQNARNVILPTPHFVTTTAEKLHEHFDKFCESIYAVAIFATEMIERVVFHDNNSYTRKCPWMTHETMLWCDSYLKSSTCARLCGTNTPQACSQRAPLWRHHTCFASSVLSSSFFFSHRGLDGQRRSPRVQTSQPKMHASTSTHGILDLAVAYQFVAKSVLSTQHCHVLRQQQNSFNTKAPSAFQLLKWKSKEQLNDLKFQLVISHSQHFPKRLSRLMRRSLSIISAISAILFFLYKTFFTGSHSSGSLWASFYSGAKVL